MQENFCENFLIEGASGRNMLCDISYSKTHNNNRIVILTHGFKSFKDWGCWPWLSSVFAKAGYTFIKLNFSHNGVGITAETASDFIDLEAFGNNNFSKQMADIDALMRWIKNKEHAALAHADINNIICIGHSMGGGMAILAAAKYNNISQLVTLNSMGSFADLFKRFNIEQWQKDNVVYVENARTSQQMPLYYQLYADYMQHEAALDITSQVASINTKWLLVYATKDETVLPKNALMLQQLNKNIKLCAIENTGHTFGAGHPFVESAENKWGVVLEHIFNALQE